MSGPTYQNMRMNGDHMKSKQLASQSRFGPTQAKTSFSDSNASQSRNRIPIYYKLYVLLAQKIRDGEWTAGDALPSESDMTAEYSVSRVTVRKALKELEDEGLIIRRRGAKSIVAPLPTVNPSTLIQGPVDNLLTRGLAAEAENLEVGWAVPPAYALRALRLPENTECYLVRRLRRHANTPFSYSRVYVTPEAAAPIVDIPPGHDPVLVHLERKGFLASAGEQTLSATLAQDPVASALQVPVGSALIQLRRTVFNDDGKPCLYQISLYRPDKYEYFMRLSRQNSSMRPQWRHT